MTKPTLILASASPRRHALLHDMGCEFDIEIANVDEAPLQFEAPLDYVARVARAKANAILSAHPQAAVLSADTIVTYDGAIFGKPENQAHAIEMWQQLSGRAHEVITAICLLHGNRCEAANVSTQVTFVQVTEAAMSDYWQSGEPLDKAGAYAIQGLASAWVQQVHGSYSNVVGLPLFETNQILRVVGHNWL